MESNIKSSLKFVIADETMQLLGEKAIHLPEHDMLLIADLHLGKVEHFRKNGIGIPTGASEKDFGKIKSLVKSVNAEKVVFLGDLFHSHFNNAWYGFQDLLKELDEYSFYLVVGNHDIMEEEKYAQLNVMHQIEIGNLILTHEPMDVMVEGKYNLCGHIHPGVRLRGKGRQNLRLPCFYFGAFTGILPAFGSFTGMHVIKPMEEDHVFVVNERIVTKVN